MTVTRWPDGGSTRSREKECGFEGGPGNRARGGRMSALSRQQGHPATFAAWQPDVVQLMDEDHLVATSGVARRRLAFAASLAQFLDSLNDTEVCVLYGRFIDDLDSFCHQLERAIPGGPLERRVDGPRSVVHLLRSRQTFPGRPASKFRYYIWHDADVLVRADQLLFGRLADALAGVAAEAEYVDDDALLIHRSVYVGGPRLAQYAADPRGQLQSWYRDGRGEPFWEVVTGLRAPPVAGFDIDALEL